MIGVCTDDGECVGSPELRFAQREPAHDYQWNREGHPCATPQEQAQVKTEGRRAKTECQYREERGHHVPNRRVMGTSTKDRARTSQPVVQCRVEEQALVEKEAEVGADTVVRDNELTGNAETHNASSGPVKDDSSREDTRLWEEQGCPAWKWTNRMNDRPIEEPK